MGKVLYLKQLKSNFTTTHDNIAECAKSVGNSRIQVNKYYTLPADLEDYFRISETIRVNKSLFNLSELVLSFCHADIPKVCYIITRKPGDVVALELLSISKITSEDAGLVSILLKDIILNRSSYINEKIYFEIWWLKDEVSLAIYSKMLSSKNTVQIKPLEAGIVSSLADRYIPNKSGKSEGVCVNIFDRQLISFIKDVTTDYCTIDVVNSDAIKDIIDVIIKATSQHHRIFYLEVFDKKGQYLCLVEMCYTESADIEDNILDAIDWIYENLPTGILGKCKVDKLDVLYVKRGVNIITDWERQMVDTVEVKNKCPKCGANLTSEGTCTNLFCE